MSDLQIAYSISAAISIFLLLWLSSYDHDEKCLTLQDVVLSVGVGLIPIANLVCVIAFTAHSGSKIIVWKTKQGKK